MSEAVLKTKPESLLDLLDRLIDKGVVVNGRALLSVADVDLVCLNLDVLLSAVETVENTQGGANGARLERSRKAQERKTRDLTFSSSHDETEREIAKAYHSTLEGGSEKETEADPLPPYEEPPLADPERFFGDGKDGLTKVSQRSTKRPCEVSKPRLNIDPKKTEQGLAKLVLTIVELLRQLMERQAIRRIDGGRLTEEEVERLGEAFLKLDEKMEVMKRVFGLEDEELNFNLGPLGNLV